MSGLIRQYSPQSQTWVPRGTDGRFAPKLLSQQPAARQQEVLVLTPAPRSQGQPLVFMANRPK